MYKRTSLSKAVAMERRTILNTTLFIISTIIIIFTGLLLLLMFLSVNHYELVHCVAKNQKLADFLDHGEFHRQATWTFPWLDEEWLNQDFRNYYVTRDAIYMSDNRFDKTLQLINKYHGYPDNNRRWSIVLDLFEGLKRGDYNDPGWCQFLYDNYRFVEMISQKPEFAGVYLSIMHM